MKPKFTFKIVNGNLYEYDANGKQIHYKSSNGYESWIEYDGNDNLIHYKDSDGFETWREYDVNGNPIHFKTSNGHEVWREYDGNGNMIHYKDSDGYEEWYDSKGNHITKEQFDRVHSKPSCAGKVVEIDGVKYKLTVVE